MVTFVIVTSCWESINNKGFHLSIYTKIWAGGLSYSSSTVYQNQKLEPNYVEKTVNNH